MRTVWLNGEFVPETEAKVPIFDRALLFGQGGKGDRCRHKVIRFQTLPAFRGSLY